MFTWVGNRDGGLPTPHSTSYCLLTFMKNVLPTC